MKSLILPPMIVRLSSRVICRAQLTLARGTRQGTFEYGFSKRPPSRQVARRGRRSRGNGFSFVRASRRENAGIACDMLASVAVSKTRLPAHRTPKKFSSPSSGVLATWRSFSEPLLVLADHAVLLADLFERFQRAIQVVPFVRRHVAGAQHGALGRHAGRDERIGVDAVLFQQIAPHHDRAQILANVDRDDGGLRVAELEAETAQPFTHVGEVFA